MKNITFIIIITLALCAMYPLGLSIDKAMAECREQGRDVGYSHVGRGFPSVYCK